MMNLDIGSLFWATLYNLVDYEAYRPFEAYFVTKLWLRLCIGLYGRPQSHYQARNIM